jgi:hypothetical protein
LSRVLQATALDFGLYRAQAHCSSDQTDRAQSTEHSIQNNQCTKQHDRPASPDKVCFFCPCAMECAFIPTGCLLSRESTSVLLCVMRNVTGIMGAGFAPIAGESNTFFGQCCKIDISWTIIVRADSPNIFQKEGLSYYDATPSAPTLAICCIYLSCIS